jgi:hypothetical protein
LFEKTLELKKKDLFIDSPPLPIVIVDRIFSIDSRKRRRIFWYENPMKELVLKLTGWRTKQELEDLTTDHINRFVL